VVGQFMQSEDDMADGSTKNLPEKLFTQHMAALKGGANLISQREDVRDCRETG